MKKIILSLSVIFFITTNVFAAGSSNDGDSSAKKTNYEKKTFGVERPLDMSLNVLKFEKKFKIKLPSVKSEILKLVKEYK